MKTIGLLGGMSWESSLEYYRIINETVKKRLGSLHSARCLMYSVDFAEIEALQHAGDWDELTRQMIAAVQHLEQGGADFTVICTNTMHKFAADIAAAAKPARLIHIGECTAAEASRRGYKKVALMGTRFTMEEEFYRGKLEAAGLDVLIPGEKEREWINKLIFGELCAGVFRDESRHRIAEITGRLAGDGAESVILGCTELPLILTPEESPLPILDTMEIHAEAAVEAALKSD